MLNISLLARTHKAVIPCELDNGVYKLYSGTKILPDFKRDKIKSSTPQAQCRSEI